MRKMILLALLSVASAAAAQTVDCSTVEVSSNISLKYKESATFPNPSKDVRISLFSQPVNFSGCGYTIVSDGKNMFKYSATTQEGLARLVNPDPRNDGTYDNKLYFSFVGISGYKYPTLREGFYANDVWFIYNPATGAVDTMDYNEEVKGYMTLLKDATSGYKVDGGPIIPFFYEGKVNLAKIPVGAKTIDLYTLRRSYNDGFDRVLIDNVNHSVTIWKKHDFPKN